MKINVEVYKREMEGELGYYDVEEDRIYISNECPPEMEEQVIYHEYIHKIDPKCDGGVHSMDYIIEREMVAEIGAKMMVGDKYVDDGYIDQYVSDPMEMMDYIDEAVELLSNNGIQI